MLQLLVHSTPMYYIHSSENALKLGVSWVSWTSEGHIFISWAQYQEIRFINSIHYQKCSTVCKQSWARIMNAWLHFIYLSFVARCIHAYDTKTAEHSATVFWVFFHLYSFQLSSSEKENIQKHDFYHWKNMGWNEHPKQNSHTFFQRCKRWCAWASSHFRKDPEFSSAPITNDTQLWKSILKPVFWN